MMLFVLSLLLASLPSCKPEDCSTATIISSSGPTVCLPFDDYAQLRSNLKNDTSLQSTPSEKDVSTEIAYKYMSPLWIQKHAFHIQNLTYVDAAKLEYGHPGPAGLTWLFKARIIEAGTLSDNSLYTATMEFLTIRRSGFSNGPALAICDDSYCCGFVYKENGYVYSHGGSSAGNICSRDDFTSLRNQQSNSWRMKLEIHPNRTVGVTYAGTEDAIVHEYSHVLKPSKGLSFHVCRPSTHEFYQFRLFEIALKKIT